MGSSLHYNSGFEQPEPPKHVESSQDSADSDHPAQHQKEAAHEGPQSGVYSRGELRHLVHAWMKAERARLDTENKVQGVLSNIDDQEGK